MSQIGRNEPCPCGSGRKYKHCCLRADDERELRWRQLRGAEGRVIPELWRKALDAWGEDGLHEALRRFYRGAAVPEEPTSDREFESLFLTWFGARFAPNGRRRDRAVSAAQQWLEDRSNASDPDRRFVAELATRPVSFHHIIAVEPGLTMDLEDILTGETCRVLERSASQMVKRGGVLFARTLTLDGTSILVGCGAAAIPPAYRIDLQRLRGDLAGDGEYLSVDRVLTLDDELRRAYLTMADRLFNPRPPRMRNTDGDPLAPTTLYFDLRCRLGDAFAALQSLNVTAGDDEADVTWSATGELESFTVSWTKAGNRMNRGWDNTILGTVAGRDRTLTATVNSRRRATRLRREVEKRLGDGVIFLRSVEESVEALLAGARGDERSATEAEPPELAAVTAQLAERHWSEWLDTPVPALADQTPREAATTEEGRERLSALLDEFEWHAGDPQAPPVARLRAELGLSRRAIAARGPR